MRASRTLVSFAALAALTTLAGCGSDEAETPAAGSPASSAAADSGNAGDDETDSASGGLIDVCTQVTAAEISAILGGPVTSEEVPGGGCSFSNEDDPRAASVSVVALPLVDGAGGFEGSVSGVSMVLQGDDGAPVDGIGDQAYVKTGTFAGSELVRGSGLVRLGSTVVQADLSPDQGTTAAAVRATVVEVLTLIASKA